MNLNKVITFNNKTKTNELVIWGDIGGWDGIYGKDVRDKLMKMEGPLNVYCNSNGGAVDEAFSIYDLLLSYKDPIHFSILNAASAMTIIINAARKDKDTVKISKNGVYMIHNVSTGIQGNKEDFRKIADLMETMDNKIIDIYMNRTGIDREVFRELMKEEKYFTPAEAMKLGFVDEIVDSLDFQFNINDVENPMNFTNSVEWDNSSNIDKKISRFKEGEMETIINNVKLNNIMDNELKGLPEKIMEFLNKEVETQLELKELKIKLEEAEMKIKDLEANDNDNVDNVDVDNVDIDNVDTDNKDIEKTQEELISEKDKEIELLKNKITEMETEAIDSVNKLKDELTEKDNVITNKAKELTDYKNKVKSINTNPALDTDNGFKMPWE